MNVNAVREVAIESYWSSTEAGYVIKINMERLVEPEVVHFQCRAGAEHQRRSRLKQVGRITRTSESPRDNQRAKTRDPGLIESNWDESTHLKRDLSKHEIQGCMECGVDSYGCFEHRPSLESDLRLRETSETRR